MEYPEECTHKVECCAFAPTYGNHLKKKWKHVVSHVDEQYFQTHGSLMLDGIEYDTWEEFEDDYPDGTDPTPHLWSDYKNDSWWFCDSCHTMLMGRMTPTILEEDDDLPLSYYQELLSA